MASTTASLRWLVFSSFYFIMFFFTVSFSAEFFVLFVLYEVPLYAPSFFPRLFRSSLLISTILVFCFDTYHNRSISCFYPFCFVFFRFPLRIFSEFFWLTFFLTYEYISYELRTLLLLNLLLLKSQKHTTPRASMLSSTYHGTAQLGQSATHKAAKDVRPDQSATTQASRQSCREPACRRASICSSLCSQNQRRNRSFPANTRYNHKQLSW